MTEVVAQYDTVTFEQCFLFSFYLCLRLTSPNYAFMRRHLYSKRKVNKKNKQACTVTLVDVTPDMFHYLSTLCLLVILQVCRLPIFLKKKIKVFQKFFQEYHQSVKQVWMQIRPDIFIWVQTVCKDYQLTTLVVFFFKKINIFKKFFQEYHQSVRQFCIQIRPNKMLGLIWVQTNYKDYQPTTLVVCRSIFSKNYFRNTRVSVLDPGLIKGS